MKIVSKKAFTLIELLVVITIIGILAVGATAVYTAQIQKGRDATRINDIKVLQSSIEQVYQDQAEYPHSDQFYSGGTVNVLTYMERIPSDPKSEQSCGGNTSCDYLYVTGVDDNGIAHGEYEISTGFENKGNMSSKAAGDGGDDSIRMEAGIGISGNSTSNSGAISTDGCLDLNGAGPSSTDLIKVAYEGCHH